MKSSLPFLREVSGKSGGKGCNVFLNSMKHCMAGKPSGSLRRLLKVLNKDWMPHMILPLGAFAGFQVRRTEVVCGQVHW